MAKPWVHKINFLLGSAITQPVIGRTLGRLGRGFIRSRGFRIDTKSPWIADTIKASLFWHLYERAEVDLIRKYLRPDLDVVELGGSIGYTGLHISRKKPPRQVIVEANPHLIDIIHANLAANHVQGVDVIHAAIDYSNSETVEFRLSRNNLGSSLRSPASATTRASTTRSRRWQFAR